MSPEGESDGKRKSRAAPRIQLSVNFSSGRLEGTGLIQNLSLTGTQIRLLGTSGQPTVNAMIDLWFFIGTKKKPAAARGRVVRSSPSGFAVEFVRLDEKIHELLLAITTAAAG
jgi:hypothetical protein